MFKLLRLNLQKSFSKKAQAIIVEATQSKYEALGEKPR
jgi:biotin synthase